jgi:hypothetical protein
VVRRKRFSSDTHVLFGGQKSGFSVREALVFALAMKLKVGVKAFMY